jgi:hypothetical protein
MKTTTISRITLAATLLLGASLQACGGTSPEGEPVEKSSQDLSIFGIPVPAPTVGITVGDLSAKIDPIGAIDSLVPDAGIGIPDPLAPVNTILGDINKGVSVGFTVPGITVEGSIGLPIQLPTLPDPFADGGITIIGK